MNCTREQIELWGLTGITLRDYQIKGINWFLSCVKLGQGGILSDEMGLGKTIQTISTIISMRALYKFRKFIIIAPLSVISNWKNELTIYAPSLKFLIYMGDKNARAAIRECDDWKENELIILTTYEYIIQDTEVMIHQNFDALFMDEGHRIKNHESVLYKIIKQMTLKFKFLLTGTPIQNNVDEFYNLLVIIAPNNVLLESRTGFKKFIEGELKNSNLEMASIMEKSSELRQLVLRRTKQEVLQYLPEKREVILFHTLTNLQKKMYKSFLLKDNEVLKKVLCKSSDASTYTETRQLLNTLMQIRKCVLHPYLFDGVEEEPFQLGEHIVEVSNKMVVLDKLLNFLFERKHKVLLFSQMTKMLDIIQDYCSLRNYSYERLDGSVRSEERFLAIDRFGGNENTRLFLLSTRAGGQGLNLTAADTVIFVDSDFNPQMDLQAMARIHRPGQTRPCRTIRLVGKDSVEEMIVSRAGQKLELTRGVLGNEEFGKDKNKLANMKELVCFGADKLFATTPKDESLQSNSDESHISDTYLTRILGDTSPKGHWLTPVTNQIEGDTKTVSEIDSIYLFDGTDFNNVKKQETTKKDYEKLVSLLNINMEDANLNDNSNMRTVKMNNGSQVMLAKKNHAHTTKRDRKQKLWQDNNYKSSRITDEMLSQQDTTQPIDDNESDCASTNSSAFSITNNVGYLQDEYSLNYVVGDVTRPVDSKHGGSNSIKFVCHVVDNSGSWGAGGLFKAIDDINSQVALKYMTAFEMEDLKLGDCHVLPLSKGVEIVLMIAQKRDKNDRVSPIQLTSLQQCFSYLSKYALNKKGSVHLPRIGYKTLQFNWYGVERIINHELVQKGVDTFVYYYRSRAPSSYHTTDDNNQMTTNREISTKDEQPSEKRPRLSACFHDKLAGRVFSIDSSINGEDRKHLIRQIYAANGEVVDGNLNTANINNSVEVIVRTNEMNDSGIISLQQIRQFL